MPSQKGCGASVNQGQWLNNLECRLSEGRRGTVLRTEGSCVCLRLSIHASGLVWRKFLARIYSCDFVENRV